MTCHGVSRHRNRRTFREEEHHAFRRMCRRVRERIAFVFSQLEPKDVLLKIGLRRSWNGFRYAIRRDRNHLIVWYEQALMRLAAAERYITERERLRVLEHAAITEDVAFAQLIAGIRFSRLPAITATAHEVPLFDERGRIVDDARVVLVPDTPRGTWRFKLMEARCVR